MIDLNDPNPLLMTHFELVGFLAGVLAVLIAVVRDILRRRTR